MIHTLKHDNKAWECDSMSQGESLQRDRYPNKLSVAPGERTWKGAKVVATESADAKVSSTTKTKLTNLHPRSSLSPKLDVRQHPWPLLSLSSKTKRPNVNTKTISDPPGHPGPAWNPRSSFKIPDEMDEYQLILKEHSDRNYVPRTKRRGWNGNTEKFKDFKRKSQIMKGHERSESMKFATVQPTDYREQREIRKLSAAEQFQQWQLIEAKAKFKKMYPRWVALEKHIAHHHTAPSVKGRGGEMSEKEYWIGKRSEMAVAMMQERQRSGRQMNGEISVGAPVEQGEGLERQLLLDQIYTLETEKADALLCNMENLRMIEALKRANFKLKQKVARFERS